MKIQCQDHSLEHILQSNYLEIPRFQRPYSWEKEHWEDFWSDIFEKKAEEYFIGSMVTYANAQSKSIVDGQQRLTTATIILASIRDAYKNHDFKDRATGIQNFIERTNKNNDAVFVLKTETSYPYMQFAIQSNGANNLPANAFRNLSEEEGLLKQAFDFFNEKVAVAISDTSTKKVSLATIKQRIQKKLDELRDRVLSLKLIYVELDNEDDAYQVFETLNTRGKDLQTSDLLKNHLARQLRTKNPLADELKVHWNTIAGNIKKINIPDVTIDELIYHHWLLQTNTVRKKDLFKIIKQQIIDQKSARAYIKDLGILCTNPRLMCLQGPEAQTIQT